MTGPVVIVHHRRRAPYGVRLVLGALVLAAAIVLAAVFYDVAAAGAHPVDEKTVAWRTTTALDTTPTGASTVAWPQSYAPSVPACEASPAWYQVDVYRYDTREHRGLVDHLIAQGTLSLVHGVPEDSDVYLSATFSKTMVCQTAPTSAPPTTDTPTTAPPTTGTPSTDTTTEPPATDSSIASASLVAVAATSSSPDEKPDTPTDQVVSDAPPADAASQLANTGFDTVGATVISVLAILAGLAVCRVFREGAKRRGEHR